jgi:hypothetical protein
MKLSDVKQLLKRTSQLSFEIENDAMIPAHFHITEVGLGTKYFIDCGGTRRQEEKVIFQLWYDDRDIDHRLSPAKLLSIIELSEEKLSLPNAEIEVEYQANTIGKFNLAHNGNHFVLTNTQTACLAEDQCGIPQTKPKFKLVNNQSVSSCDPKSGCC